jgi:hypothetical protein
MNLEEINGNIMFSLGTEWHQNQLPRVSMALEETSIARELHEFVPPYPQQKWDG